MAAKTKAPVNQSSQKSSPGKIKQTGLAYKEGWSWLIIPILKFIGLIIIVLLAVALREYYGIELAGLIGALSGAKGLVGKLLGESKPLTDK